VERAFPVVAAFETRSLEIIARKLAIVELLKALCERRNPKCCVWFIKG